MHGIITDFEVALAMLADGNGQVSGIIETNRPEGPCIRQREARTDPHGGSYLCPTKVFLVSSEVFVRLEEYGLIENVPTSAPSNFKITYAGLLVLRRLQRKNQREEVHPS